MQPREHRHKVLIRAKLRTGGLPVDACIRDISSRGMLLQAKVAPPRGTYIEIITAHQTIAGRVVWGKDLRFGIYTREKLHIDVLIGELRRAPTEPVPLPAQRVVRSRARKFDGSESSQARLFEFLVVAAFAMVMIVAVSGAVFESLAGPLQNISGHLRGGR